MVRRLAPPAAGAALRSSSPVPVTADLGVPGSEADGRPLDQELEVRILGGRVRTKGHVKGLSVPIPSALLLLVAAVPCEPVVCEAVVRAGGKQTGDLGLRRSSRSLQCCDDSGRLRALRRGVGPGCGGNARGAACTDAPREGPHVEDPPSPCGPGILGLMPGPARDGRHTAFVGFRWSWTPRRVFPDRRGTAHYCSSRPRATRLDRLSGSRNGLGVAWQP